MSLLQARRVALLGAGYIADWHARALATVAGTELVAVCDVVLPRAEALAAKYGIAKCYSSLEAMLAAEHLDAVHILLPPDLHFNAARGVLNAGVSALLEKPMCATAEECHYLAQLAAERQVRLGVGHNFLFAPVYESLRRDLRSGRLGRIDHVTLTWNREMPQAKHGPFHAWMLRDPRNILLETGPHLVAQMLDLVGMPDSVTSTATNPVALPTGTPFYRRWQVKAEKGSTAVDLNFSFVPGFAEFSVHVRGSLAAATVDFERNTYTLERHAPADPDFDTFAQVTAKGQALRRQAWTTLTRYIASKLKFEQRGNPYGESIARAMDAFYAPGRLDERLTNGAEVIALCERMGQAARTADRPSAPVATASPAEPPRILVLGGTGFIGRELVRQLIAEGRSVRLLARGAATVPSGAECVRGDLLDRGSLIAAMQDVETVVHLARANVKSWQEYQCYEIGATRNVAECALEAGVRRLVYTGTIDSYYTGAGAITEETPLDSKIERRNLYARAKAHSEQLLTALYHERKLPVVILRPGVVIGSGGSPFHWGVGMWWSDAVCQLWGRGTNTLPLVLVEDVARALIAAIDRPALEGRSYNLVADPCLTAEEYLDALDHVAGIRVDRRPTPIWRFYALDLLKWAVKTAVRHPGRRLPMYRDWESRTNGAHFDCTAAKRDLDWLPTSCKTEMIERGIAVPVQEYFR